MAEPTPPGTEPGEGQSPESLVGTVLAGRYRLVKLLGWGAMGAVYVGEHLKIGRRDAIKVLRGSLARDPETVARFARGARNASAIRHVNVCTVYDFSDTSEGLQFLAMELVDGESLTGLLEREGPLPVERAARIAIQAASALEAAHDLGIVHRDMKPDNIMITRDRDGADLAKVVDFDIAKGSAEGEEKGVTRLGFVVGTPEYMSPEQLTGDPLDGRSDLYSLALVFFRMITGDLPYRNRSTQELMVDRLTRDPMKLSEVASGTHFPPSVQAFMDRALARERENRQADARQFARELWDAVYGDAAASGAAAPAEQATMVVAAEPGRTTAEALPATVVAPRGDPTAAPRAAAPATKPPRPRWMPLAVGGGAVVVIGVVAVALLSRSGGQPAEVAVPPSLALTVGESARVSATVRDGGGGVMPDAAVQWTSSSPDVASVDATGNVRGLQAGTASVRASAGSVGGVTEVTVSAASAAAAPRLGRRTIAFAVPSGGGRPGAESVEVTGEGGSDRTLVSRVTYPAGAAQGWLSARLEGTSTPTTVVVEPGAPPSSPGRYTAAVVVGWDGGGPADTVQVTLDVERASPQPQPQPPTRLTPKQANDRAWNQLFILDDIVNNNLSAAQATRARRAVKDTTGALWSATYLPDSIRARAAYAHAQAAVELQELDEGLDWARRATDAAPNDVNYRDFLRKLGGGG
jgi:hypothetical protein